MGTAQRMQSNGDFTAKAHHFVRGQKRPPRLPVGRTGAALAFGHAHGPDRLLPKRLGKIAGTIEVTDVAKPLIGTVGQQGICGLTVEVPDLVNPLRDQHVVDAVAGHGGNVAGHVFDPPQCRKLVDHDKAAMRRPALKGGTSVGVAERGQHDPEPGSLRVDPVGWDDQIHGAPFRNQVRQGEARCGGGRLDLRVGQKLGVLPEVRHDAGIGLLGEVKIGTDHLAYGPAECGAGCHRGEILVGEFLPAETDDFAGAAKGLCLAGLIRDPQKHRRQHIGGGALPIAVLVARRRWANGGGKRLGHGHAIRIIAVQHVERVVGVLADAALGKDAGKLPPRVEDMHGLCKFARVGRDCRVLAFRVDDHGRTCIPQKGRDDDAGPLPCPGPGNDQRMVFRRGANRRTWLLIERNPVVFGTAAFAEKDTPIEPGLGRHGADRIKIAGSSEVVGQRRHIADGPPPVDEAAIYAP